MIIINHVPPRSCLPVIEGRKLLSVCLAVERNKITPQNIMTMRHMYRVTEIAGEPNSALFQIQVVPCPVVRCAATIGSHSHPALHCERRIQFAVNVLPLHSVQFVQWSPAQRLSHHCVPGIQEISDMATQCIREHLYDLLARFVMRAWFHAVEHVFLQSLLQLLQQRQYPSLIG